MSDITLGDTYKNESDRVEKFINEELSDERIKQDLAKLIEYKENMIANPELLLTENILLGITDFQKEVLDRVYGLREKYSSILNDPNERTYVTGEAVTMTSLGDKRHPLVVTTDRRMTSTLPKDVYTIINTLGIQRRELPLIDVNIPFDDLKLCLVPKIYITGGDGTGLSIYAHIVALDDRDRILVTPYDRSITMREDDGIGGKPKVVAVETRLSTFEFCMRIGYSDTSIPNRTAPNLLISPHTGGYGPRGRNGASALSTIESGFNGLIKIPEDNRTRMMIYLLSNLISTKRLHNGTGQLPQ